MELETTFVASKILRHFCKWENVTVMLAIVIFMDICYTAVTGVRYVGDYHVSRTPQFMDTDKHRRCDQFMDTTLGADACVLHA